MSLIVIGSHYVVICCVRREVSASVSFRLNPADNREEKPAPLAESGESRPSIVIDGHFFHSWSSVKSRTSLIVSAGIHNLLLVAEMKNVLLITFPVMRR